MVSNGVRSDYRPLHHYWTDNQLQFGGYGDGNCYATLSGGNSCNPTSSPIRVCADSPYDPEGNACNWRNCGLDTTSPNEYFGGCNGNYTAGTLCCQ